MNKKKIEKMLPVALKVLQEEKCGIKDEKTGKIDKSYRSAISSFGAAVTMGSFRAAVSFFSKDAEKGDSGIKRSLLLRAMDHVVHPDKEWCKLKEAAKEIQAIVIHALNTSTNIRQMQDDYLHAAVALKLAMNAFDMSDEKKDKPREVKDQDAQPESAVQ